MVVEFIALFRMVSAPPASWVNLLGATTVTVWVPTTVVPILALMEPSPSCSLGVVPTASKVITPVLASALGLEICTLSPTKVTLLACAAGVTTALRCCVRSWSVPPRVVEFIPMRIGEGRAELSDFLNVTPTTLSVTTGEAIWYV